MKDIFKNDIKIGDRVAVAYRYGNSCELCVGKVIKFGNIGATGAGGKRPYLVFIDEINKEERKLYVSNRCAII